MFLVRPFLLAVDRINIYGPVITSAAFPYAVILLASYWIGLRPTSIPSGILIHSAIWPQQIWAKKWRGAAVRFLGEAGSPWTPSNTVWPGLRPTCVPSGILTHPTVCPQHANVTRPTHRQRLDSKQTVAQNLPRALLCQTSCIQIHPN